jgi:hypothetical protein
MCRFEDLVNLLKNPDAVKRVKLCLERFHRLSNLVNKVTISSSSKEPQKVQVRIFMAAYMIVAYPGDVLEDKTAPAAVAVLESAQEVLRIFEAILKSANAPFRNLPSDISKSLPPAIFKYMDDFKAWKVPDEAKLIQRIKHALVALCQSMQSLPPDEPEDSTLNVDFRSTISRLRSKMIQIIGREEVFKFESGQP